MPVHAIALKCQIRIEPQRRRYEPAEEDRLLELFGETRSGATRCGRSCGPTSPPRSPAFTGATTIDLAGRVHLRLRGRRQRSTSTPSTAATIPLVLLFSGTAFTQGDAGFAVEPVAWHEEATYRLPVAVWRDVMDLYFPNSGWLRVDRDTLDAPAALQGRRGPCRRGTRHVEQLLKEAGEDGR